MHQLSCQIQFYKAARYSSTKLPDKFYKTARSSLQSYWLWLYQAARFCSAKRLDVLLQSYQLWFYKSPKLLHCICYTRCIILLTMLYCSANLLCFCNIKCSFKQLLPRVLSLIAPILKIPHHHTFTQKAAIRFLSSLHQLLYFCFRRFLKIVLPFIFPRFFYQWSRGV